MNTKLVREVSDITNEILEAEWNISDFEALQIAVKIQHNKILSAAFVLNHNGPGALEAIAMELGACKDGTTIKDALYNLKA